MIRNLIISAAILLVASVSSAAPCSSSDYVKVMPDHKGIEFGMTSSQALAAAKKLYQGKARVTKKTDGDIDVDFLRSHQNIFDQVLFITTNGVVTGMAWSYSNQFQKRLGGPSDAFIAVLKKLKETVGKADSNRDIEKGFSFTWNEKGGLKLTAIGVDPFTIITRFECTSLEEAEREKVRKSTNMGF